METNNEQIKTLQDAIKANKQFIYHHDEEIHKNTKEISILAKRNINMLDIRNRMISEVEKLEKELNQINK